MLANCVTGRGMQTILIILSGVLDFNTVVSPPKKKYEYAKVFLLFPLVSSSFHLGEALSDGSTPHDRACLLIMGQRSLEKRRRLSWADLKQKNVICRAGDSCFITNTFVVF